MKFTISMARAMSRRAARIALIDGSKFGTVSTTVPAYRADLIETLADFGAEALQSLALEEFDLFISDDSYGL